MDMIKLYLNYAVCVSILLLFSLAKQKQLLGPGTYNINDFIDQMAKKPGSTRGVCETREARFDTTKMVCSKIMLPSCICGRVKHMGLIAGTSCKFTPCD